jgi:hypothetical protein
MPKIDTTPANLKPFLFHSVDLHWKDGDDQATADCPWCGREGKFSVQIATGVWKCWSCQSGTEKGGGNIRLFLEMLWKQSDSATTNYRLLADDRKLLNPDTLIHWGVCQSVLTHDWIVPGFNEEGKLWQLYRYLKTHERFALLPTPTLGHRLHGVNLYDKSKSEIYLCEGCWDGMSLWEHLGSHKAIAGGEGMIEEEDLRLISTASIGHSLLADANVLAVPGCSVFSEEWIPLFENKIVHLMYDNDHPRKNPTTGKLIKPGALESMKRAASILMSRKHHQPKKINFMRWGTEGFNLKIPHGYDVRDVMTRGIPLCVKEKQL